MLSKISLSRFWLKFLHAAELIEVMIIRKNIVCEHMELVVENDEKLWDPIFLY